MYCCTAFGNLSVNKIKALKWEHCENKKTAKNKKKKKNSEKSAGSIIILH